MCNVRKFTFVPVYNIEIISTYIFYFEEKIT